MTPQQVAILIIWISFGLVNLFIMWRADVASGNNPPYDVYWIKGRVFLVFITTILYGPIVIPFTIWAFRDWRRLSRTGNKMANKSNATGW